VADSLSGSRLPPALFDTRGEFARDLPLDLIRAWRAAGERDADAARELLDPFRVTGTVVVSDSAGLTRLSRTREPLEVMALINQPKEIVHELGVAIGGRGLGVWTADNTEMFYPEEVGGDRVAAMLLGAQDRIRCECEVQIGMAAHFDTFFLVGNSVYGAAAMDVEILAEDRTVGGEIVLTGATWERVRTAGFEAAERDGGDGFRLTGGQRFTCGEPGKPCAERYPLPFSIEFHDCLREYSLHRSAESLREKVRVGFARNCTVLLVEREPVESELPEMTILMEMERSAVAGAMGALLLGSMAGKEVKTAGSLSIYVFANTEEAWAFAHRLRERLAAEGIRIRAGIASGEVLLFDLEGGGKDISGVPVNMASKVAQDQGQFGRIYVLDCMRSLREERMTVAGAEIPVWVCEG
jgi:class 3 adenylate cyclase